MQRSETLPVLRRPHTGSALLLAMILVGAVAAPALAAQVPDVQGLGIAEARRVIEQAGLSARVIGGDPAPTASLEFAVQSQEPYPRSELPPGGTVILRVYSQQSEVGVPSVVGLRAPEARRRLEAAGLAVELAGGDPSPDAARAFTVQSQRPGPGAFAVRGQKVRVRVYGAAPSGPAPPSPTRTPAATASVVTRETRATATPTPRPRPEAAAPIQADPYVFDVLRPGASREAVCSGLDQPVSSHRGAEGDLVEVFEASERGIGRATVWYDATGVVRWARVQLVNRLPAYATALLFDLQGNAEVSPGYAFAPDEDSFGETHSYGREGVHLFVHGDIVREIWLTLPREDLEDVADLVSDGLV